MPIPVDKLQAISTIVTHGNCPDGLASAIVLDDVLPGREIIFAVHQITPLEAKPGMLFCDFCPPRDRAEEFRKVGAIVLDHHRTMRDVVESFEHGIYADEKTEPGVSGATLAWREVWKSLHPQWLGRDDDFQPEVVQEFAELAGVRDTWQQKDPRWQRACEQSEMMLFYPQGAWLGPLRPELLRARNVETLCERVRVGSLAFQRKLEGSQKLAEKAYYFTTGARATRVAILPARHVSDAADMVLPGTELIIGFSYTVEEGKTKMLLSTRSRNGYDCSKFAVFYGGGGHTAAAGCQVDVAPRSLNPYDMVRDMVERFEAR